MSRTKRKVAEMMTLFAFAQMIGESDYQSPTKDRGIPTAYKMRKLEPGQMAFIEKDGKLVKLEIKEYDTRIKEIILARSEKAAWKKFLKSKN